MLEASLLWYQKFRRDLESVGFKFDPYGGCVANRMVKGNQHTILFHVVNLKSSHVDSRVNDEFALWLQKIYGGIKDVSAKRGKVHEFLGMKPDFGCKVCACHVTQEDHVEDSISLWPEEFKNEDIALTCASLNLFERGGGGLLNNVQREKLHSVVVKGIFLCNRSRPDITPTISVLSGRVREPTKSNWEKVRQLVKYLHSTRYLHLVLRCNGMCLTKWNVNASFAVHNNFRSQSCGVLFLNQMGGGITSSSNRQHLNTRSSTEAELEASDDFLSKILWVLL